MRSYTTTMSQIIFNLYSEYLTKKPLKGFGDFKVGGQVICTVNYAENLVLLTVKWSECRKNYSNEYLSATIPNTDYDRS